MKQQVVIKSQLLRSRGWRPGSHGQWAKRGWSVALEDAYVIEEYYEHRNGAVTPRHEATETELRDIRRILSGATQNA